MTALRVAVLGALIGPVTAALSYRIARHYRTGAFHLAGLFAAILLAYWLALFLAARAIASTV